MGPLPRRATFAVVALASSPVHAPSPVASARRALLGQTTIGRRAPSWPSGIARVSAAPPAGPRITVTVALAPTAGSGISTSLDVSYRASLSARCRSTGTGASQPCPLPGGTLVWRVDGAGASPGNVTAVTHRLGNCTTSVSARHRVPACLVNWPTFGDQWLTATYDSAPSSALGRSVRTSATMEVDVRAPVDLATERRFAGYDNAGPDAIEDCTFAAVADWIEVTDGAPPPARSIVPAYWRAERADDPGADIGLTAAQLFDYWRIHGIGGTTLTSATPVPLSGVEAHLTGGRALLATAALPAGFPAGSTAPAAHAWLVVGFSSYGPMVVTWGEEVQLTWARFDAWTTGMWAITATAPRAPATTRPTAPRSSAAPPVTVHP